MSWRRDFREWALLSAYGVIGYGERLFAPLAIWAVLCFALPGVMILYGLASADVSYWRLLMHVAAAPLAFFRIASQRPNAPGVWDTAVYAFAQVAGTALIGFALLATRRVLRPESKV